MNATAVERITPPKTEPSHHVRQVLPPFIGVLVKWGLFALVGIGIVLSVVLGLVQKWLWMRQLDYADVDIDRLTCVSGVCEGFVEEAFSIHQVDILCRKAKIEPSAAVEGDAGSG
jgi:hypothetical protein